MEVVFDVNTPTELCEIMGRNKSDKGHLDIQKSWHNYTTFYYSLFQSIRQKHIKLFELGIGTTDTSIINNMGPNGRPGASLYGWREFFPNSQIFGADIDRRILFSDTNIKTFYCDSTNPSAIQTMWQSPDLDGFFDIIIDDGYHNLDANLCFFSNSKQKLAQNGVFIIEDLFIDASVEQRLRSFFNATEFTCTILKLPSSVNTNKDNNLVILQKKSSMPISPKLLE